MSPLLPNEQLSSERQEKLMVQFRKTFNRRYPSSGLSISQGSLDYALSESIFNLDDVSGCFNIQENKIQ